MQAELDRRPSSTASRAAAWLAGASTVLLALLTTIQVVSKNYTEVRLKQLELQQAQTAQVVTKAADDAKKAATVAVTTAAATKVEVRKVAQDVAVVKEQTK